MTKKPNRNRNIEKEYEPELIRKYTDEMSVLDGYTKKQAENFYYILKRSVTDRIITKAGSDARLSALDEKLYEYYSKLMEYYNNAVLLYVQEKDSIKSVRLKAILESIYSMLNSQLKQYRDSISESNCNPIREEKSDIIKRSIAFFIRSFDEELSHFKNEYTDEYLLFARKELAEVFTYGGALNVIEFIINLTSFYFYENLYKYYGYAVKMCVTNLNDQRLREQTLYYYSLLDREQSNLASIMKVQIKALEREMERPDFNDRVVEKALAENVLINLREGYQYLGGEIKDIMHGFNEAAAKKSDIIPIEDYVSFISYLKEITDPNYIFSAHTYEHVSKIYNEKKDEFENKLSNYACEVIEKRLIKPAISKSVYELHKKASAEISMADDLIDAFDIKDSYLESFGSTAVDSAGSEIIKGINETISIKIENIKENKAAFNEKIKELTTDIYSEEAFITPNEKQKISALFYERWRSVYSGILNYDDGMSLYEFSNGIINNEINNEIMATLLQRIEKSKLQREDKANKAIMEFKKEHLLYEISTFEEILNYSVSRLKQSDNEADVRYAGLVDGITDKIKISLKKNNIEIISPQPHEAFNGKEHEVLMAEKNDEFKKGEIIKLMNSGYRQNDLILLRANVIAAR